MLESVRLSQLRRPQAAPAERRPAPTRRPRPGARQPSQGAAARRAARRPRPQAPRRDAGRAEEHPARGRDHVRVRHPRPRRGAVDEQPHRRVQQRADRAGGRSPRRSTRRRRRLRGDVRRHVERALGAAVAPAARRRRRPLLRPERIRVDGDAVGPTTPRCPGRCRTCSTSAPTPTVRVGLDDGSHLTASVASHDRHWRDPRRRGPPDLPASGGVRGDRHAAPPSGEAGGDLPELTWRAWRPTPDRGAARRCPTTTEPTPSEGETDEDDQTTSDGGPRGRRVDRGGRRRRRQRHHGAHRTGDRRLRRGCRRLHVDPEPRRAGGRRGRGQHRRLAGLHRGRHRPTRPSTG